VLDRRTFYSGLAVGLLAAGARAQQAPKVIGVLSSFSSPEFEPRRENFVQAMRDLGYTNGKQFVLIERLGNGRTDRLTELAAELAKLNVDLIYAMSAGAVAAAQKATTTIPIVFDNVAEPVANGFADSLSHPGRNITGLTSIASDLNPKRVQFLKEMVPKLTRLALLTGAKNPFNSSFEPSMQAAAAPLGIRLRSFSAAGPGELEAAFDSMSQWGAEALVQSGDLYLFRERQRIAELALKGKLASAHPTGDFVEVGGLLSYGVDPTFMNRKVAQYVIEILKGAKAGDLPIQQPTEVILVINRGTANALKLTIPQRLLMQADKVIG